MLPELGVLCLIFALIASILLVCIPSIGLYRNNLAFQKSADYYVKCVGIFVLLAYVALTLSFITDDFTVFYVRMNSSTLLPFFYKLCAVWGGHEGSMLLWILILTGWMMAVTYFSKSLESAFRIRMLIVFGGLHFGLLLFVLSTSNPFLREFSMAMQQGRDLNPLLQDIGFLFHPPMLYMGYVGTSVGFVWAFAALWLGQSNPVWAKWLRPWCLAAWCCLTLGITLGSWWAYRELGWGGWWFWDPVENASFMPWLTLTALIHALIVYQKRQQLYAWTLSLAILTFSLSLIGTFLVRSGVLISVHAFAVDSSRGLFILVLLTVIISIAWILFGLRSNQLASDLKLELISRESSLLLNNVILVVLMFTVLLGTLYPLIMDGLNLGKLSVGAPYFNAVFVPMTMPFFILLGIGTHVRWQKDEIKHVFFRLKWAAIISVLLPYLLLLGLHGFSWSIWLGLASAMWIIIGTLMMLKDKMKRGSILHIKPSFWGMFIAHLGVAMTIIGIAVSSGFGIQQDVKIAPGQEITLAGHLIRFVSESSLTGPNFHGTKACFKVAKAGYSHIIFPEKRIYDIGKMVMTDSAIDVSPFRDIYIALGEPLEHGAWSVRLYYKPCVRWIWAGGLFLFFGGFIALIDKRYRTRNL